jgi:hypothetical protein
MELYVGLGLIGLATGVAALTAGIINVLADRHFSRR